MQQNKISIAIDKLNKGELIIFPTDTLYALGADPRNDQAINKVFAFKGRAHTQALPVLLAKPEELNDWIDQDNLNVLGLNQILWDLVGAFWPGSLTIVVKKSKNVSNLLTANQDNIALRIPNHPLALELLTAFGSGIIGTSANKSGKPNLIDYQAISKTFAKDIYLLSDDQQPLLGVGSTIVSLVGGECKILREGAISRETLKRYYNDFG